MQELTWHVRVVATVSRRHDHAVRGAPVRALHGAPGRPAAEEAKARLGSVDFSSGHDLFLSLLMGPGGSRTLHNLFCPCLTFESLSCRYAVVSFLGVFSPFSFFVWVACCFCPSARLPNPGGQSRKPDEAFSNSI